MGRLLIAPLDGAVPAHTAQLRRDLMREFGGGTCDAAAIRNDCFTAEACSLSGRGGGQPMLQPQDADHCIIATRRRRFAGCVYVTRRAGHIGISNLCVRRSLRKHGIGTELLAQVARLFPNVPARLDVLCRGRASAAVPDAQLELDRRSPMLERYYTRLGFSVSRRTPERVYMECAAMRPGRPKAALYEVRGFR